MPLDHPDPSAITPPSIPASASELKLRRVLDACRVHDLSALFSLAAEPLGFVTDTARRRAWPILLGHDNQSGTTESRLWRNLPPHPDEDQVALDVNRSFVYYPKGEASKQLDVRKSDLQDVIVSTLRRNPFLCYFQGYHDIVQVLLLVLGPAIAPAAVDRLSLLRVRDFMLPSLSAAVQHLALLPCILRVADPELEKHVSVTQPFFALAATLTLYAHEIEEYADIARLFDFLLATEASMSIYLFAVTILSRRTELLEIEREEPEMMHAILSKLPKPLDLDKLITGSLDLFRRHPPQSLPRGAWRRVDGDSVLRTTQDLERVASQTLQQGREAFARQSNRLWRQQVADGARAWVWAYRRPAASVGLAVAVAMLAFYLQRHGSESPLPGVLRRLKAVWHGT